MCIHFFSSCTRFPLKLGWGGGVVQMRWTYSSSFCVPHLFVLGRANKQDSSKYRFSAVLLAAILSFTTSSLPFSIIVFACHLPLRSLPFSFSSLFIFVLVVVKFPSNNYIKCFYFSFFLWASFCIFIHFCVDHNNSIPW